MTLSPEAALTKPGNLVFSSNLHFAADIQAAGGRVIQQPSGHFIFYGPHGQRILATDPEGNPLHECAWMAGPDGTLKLVCARFQLDWGQWVGLKPGELVNSTVLDLSRKPGWERLQADDLRRMAAQALRVPFEEVRFFYGDEDLVIDRQGQATIRHKKDTFYVLDEGTFDAPADRVKFMACMGTMHWARIDFLPVVELFQSLLPGTGSAAFELIRGLYDDQNEGQAHPLPLRYRGIPTYPSQAAYRLFSSFFTPQVSGGGDPFPVFMDVPRSQEVTWLPTPVPPRRHFDHSRRLCVTVKEDMIQKATLADDATGLPYIPARSGPTPCGRSLGVAGGRLVLQDGPRQSEIPINPLWGNMREFAPAPEKKEQRPGWQAFFGGSPPLVAAREAFGAVLLYPDDDREIEELPTQPFVADYLQDIIEQRPDLAAHLARAQSVLIHNFDAAVNTCIQLDRPRDYRVLYQHPPFAQKQAQGLWNQMAQARKLDWAKRIMFVPEQGYREQAYEQPYDLIYRWIAFIHLHDGTEARRAAQAVAAALRPEGLAFVAGPSTLAGELQAARICLLQAVPVPELPTFHMHRTILPKARIRAGLTLFIGEKA